jgi:hypothetical protein
MKNISGWLLLFALLLCAPVAHADGSAFGTFPSTSGVNDGGAFVSSFNSDGYSAGNYNDAARLSSQSTLQSHSNWIAAGPHVQTLVVAAPEPGMLLMLATGLLGVGFFTRHKMGNSPLKRSLV